MPKCQTCRNMTIEQHESYMGIYPTYCYGKCDKGCDKIPRDKCDLYEEGEPHQKDCRIPGDW